MRRRCSRARVVGAHGVLDGTSAVHAVVTFDPGGRAIPWQRLRITLDAESGPEGHSWFLSTILCVGCECPRSLRRRIDFVDAAGVFPVRDFVNGDPFEDEVNADPPRWMATLPPTGPAAVGSWGGPGRPGVDVPCPLEAASPARARAQDQLPGVRSVISTTPRIRLRGGGFVKGAAHAQWLGPRNRLRFERLARRTGTPTLPCDRRPGRCWV